MGVLLAAAAVGCSDALVQRVSNEFECDPARVNVLERHDIADTVYDVEACGRRGRYSCVGGGQHGVYGCIHEPDPPKWDPDPALAANLPAPRWPPSATPPVGQRRRICGRRERECDFKENGVWQWRSGDASISSDGCGSMCQ